MECDTMMHGFKIAALTVLLAGLPPGAVNGRVFRIVGDSRGRLNAAGLPWEMAYETAMNVNGRHNDVVVYSVHYSEPVIEQLKVQFEQQGARVKIGAKPGGGAMGTARWDGGEARILVLVPDSQPNNLVFLFYPESGEGRVPSSPIPDYPRGSVRNTVVNEDTEAFCTTLTTMDSVEQVQRYYTEVLTGDGWAPLLPLPLSGGMTYFHRNESTCCVMAKVRNGGETVVTVLVRDKGF
jgi:hypothetical protein